MLAIAIPKIFFASASKSGQIAVGSAALAIGFQFGLLAGSLRLVTGKEIGYAVQVVSSYIPLKKAQKMLLRNLDKI